MDKMGTVYKKPTITKNKFDIKPPSIKSYMAAYVRATSPKEIIKIPDTSRNNNGDRIELRVNVVNNPLRVKTDTSHYTTTTNFEIEPDLIQPDIYKITGCNMEIKYSPSVGPKQNYYRLQHAHEIHEAQSAVNIVKNYFNTYGAWGDLRSSRNLADFANPRRFEISRGKMIESSHADSVVLVRDHVLYNNLKYLYPNNRRLRKSINTIKFYRKANGETDALEKIIGMPVSKLNKNNMDDVLKKLDLLDIRKYLNQKVFDTKLLDKLERAKFYSNKALEGKKEYKMTTKEKNEDI